MTRHSGLTLVELVIVVMILGILAAMAVPRLLDVSGDATDKGLRQTLSVIRDAIEMYAAENGGRLPGTAKESALNVVGQISKSAIESADPDENESTFKSDLRPYLRKFPPNPVGADDNKRDRVKIVSKGVPLSAAVDNNEGWIYDYTTGEFRANNNALSSDGVTPYSKF